MQWQNWPWAGIANRHGRAAAALVVTLGGGYLLMLVFKALLNVILPATVRNAEAFPLALETAQLGVCFSLWALIIGPSKIGNVALARTVRTAVVEVLAVATYVFFMRYFATTVLHFPATDGRYGGAPLLWMDWTILLVLW